MFKISPIQDEKRLAEVAALCRVTVRPGAFAYQMTDCDTGAVMGMSQFEIGSDGGFLYDLTEIPDGKDTEAMFILGRATLNFIDLCGVHSCEALPDAGEAQLLHAVGFRQKGNRLFCDMTGMFDGHCDGKAVSLPE